MNHSTTLLLDEGLRLQRQGSLSEAVARYEAVLRADPSSEDATYYIAVVACQIGDFGKGIEYARRALALDQGNAKAANLLGRAQQGLGRRNEALVSFDFAISKDPGFAEAHGNRAALLMETGQLSEALESFDRAVALNPNSIADWQDRGNVLVMLGRPGEAAESYDRVLALNPDVFEAHLGRAGALLAQERRGEALTALTPALMLRPMQPEALTMRAKILLRMGGASEALADLDSALGAGAGFPTLLLRGVALGQLRRHNEALACFDQILRIEPANFDAVINRGTALNELGRHGEALRAFDEATALKADSPSGYFGRGHSLVALRRFRDAVPALDKGLVLQPGDTPALCSRGSALLELGRHQEALASLDQALAIQPSYVPALTNRGLAMSDLRQHEEALKNYEQAVSIDPEFAAAHWNEATLRLLLGEYRRGWEKYEWRSKVENSRLGQRDFSVGRWRGEELPGGTTMLLHTEQGLGDTIQFARYAPLVARRGAKVILEVQGALMTLCKGISGVTVIGRSEPLPRFDLHCPLLNLPAVFDTTVETIPAQVPYVSVPSDQIVRWGERLPRDKDLKIGVAWSGNHRFLRDHYRSMTLAQFAPILDTPEISFVTLNPGLSMEDQTAVTTQRNVIHLAKQFSDFVDTAAVIENLDLVITTDTSIAHLAGALGKPVWILLCHVADWRWLLDRNDSPWYPTARLFRQHRLGDWTDVIREVEAELARFAPA